MRVLGSCIAALFVAAGVSPASAQTRAQDAAIDAALACRSIADATARLECLDKAAAAIAETRVVHEETTTVEETAQDQLTGFGAPPPKKKRSVGKREVTETKEDFGSEQVRELRKETESARLRSIEEKVVEVRLNRFQHATFTLANGQTWRQLDSDTFTLPITEGKLYTVVVKRGAVGNYMLTVKELKRTIRVRRIR